MSSKTALFVLVPAVLLLAFQLVPYGHDHGNPPDGTPARFDSPETEALARRACFDCHSNHTKWPWYASIAPMSWRVQSHVQEGRETLNFTAFDAASEKMTDAAGEASESVAKGEMPPLDYLLMHSEARLTPDEKSALANGLGATFSAFGEENERAEAGEGGHRVDPESKEATRSGRSRHERDEDHEGGEDRD